jgi:hypothetical protein
MQKLRVKRLLENIERIPHVFHTGNCGRSNRGRLKLPLEIEKQIAERRHRGETLSSLSKEFGVTDGAIIDIYRRRCPDWRAFQLPAKEVRKNHEATTARLLLEFGKIPSFSVLKEMGLLSYYNYYKALIRGGNNERQNASNG